MAIRATGIQSVQNVELTGDIQSVEFEKMCSVYLVKNLTDAEIYVSFDPEMPEESNIQINSNVAQKCFISERGGIVGAPKATGVYLKGAGTGHVEIQQLDI